MPPRWFSDERIALADQQLNDPSLVDQRLRKMANAVLTPHLGSAVPDVREVMANIVVDNILALIERRKLPNCVNPQVFAL